MKKCKHTEVNYIFLQPLERDKLHMYVGKYCSPCTKLLEVRRVDCCDAEVARYAFRKSWRVWDKVSKIAQNKMGLSL